FVVEPTVFVVNHGKVQSRPPCNFDSDGGRDEKPRAKHALAFVEQTTHIILFEFECHLYSALASLMMRPPMTHSVMYKFPSGSDAIAWGLLNFPSVKFGAT